MFKKPDSVFFVLLNSGAFHDDSTTRHTEVFSGQNRNQIQGAGEGSLPECPDQKESRRRQKGHSRQVLCSGESPINH